MLPSIGLGPGLGEVGQGGLKVFHFWRHIPNQTIFCECKLEDLLRLLSLWIALKHFQRPSYACAKPHVIWLFCHENPQMRLDAKVFIGNPSNDV